MITFTPTTKVEDLLESDELIRSANNYLDSFRALAANMRLQDEVKGELVIRIPLEKVKAKEYQTTPRVEFIYKSKKDDTTEANLAQISLFDKEEEDVK